MDFARRHDIIESTASRSGVKYIQDTKRENRLDELTLEASNLAVKEILFTKKDSETVTDDDVAKMDTKHYVDRVFPHNEEIREGDLVVVMEAFDALSFVYAKKGAMIDNKNGHFSHNDFIGKPFGCKIRSRNNQGYGFIHLLKPTPELWSRSLNHRTQIVHELDQAQIISQLGLRPNMVVVESGTGSAAMSHGICRTIAPYGHLHTYEFNESRATVAREEIEQHGLSKICTVYHRDVCHQGFDRPEASVDAAFLDLPEPWTAIPQIVPVLKRNARLATYSPCVEQTQRTIEAMNAHGFHSIKTMEYRFCEHYVDEVTYEGPPKTKRPRFSNNNSQDVPDNRAEEKDESMSDSKINRAETLETGINNDSKTADDNARPKKMLVARPFGTMRGHTAFLTFATAGNSRQSQSDTDKE